MEITYEEAELMLKKRLLDYPEVEKLLSDPEFNRALADILSLEGVSQDLFSLILNELKVVLLFYIPISELAQNISASTELPLNTSENLVVMIESLLLEPVKNDLYAFDYHIKNETSKINSVPDANSDLKERLELKPQVTIEAKKEEAQRATLPLTREELMNALAPKRTMASDIEAVKQKTNSSDTSQV